MSCSPNSGPVPVSSPTITFHVGSLVPFRHSTFATSGVRHAISVKLEDGDHAFTSNEFALGIAHASGGRRVIAQVTFRYSYSAKNRTVTVCGTDYPSADGMTLITKMKGSSNDICMEHAAYGIGFSADQGLTNRTWNYRTRLMPGAAKVIKDIVRSASDSLIAALTASHDITVVQVRHTVPESLSASDYHNLSLVYREGKFLEVHNPTSQYLKADEIVPVDSTFGGFAHWNQNTAFANVIGSTNDPYPQGYNSWISLYRAMTNSNPTTCTSLNWGSGHPFQCTNPPTPLGGHVILGQTAAEVNTGANQVAAIFPICVAHNNNDNVYMSTLQYNTGVWLNNYNS